MRKKLYISGLEYNKYRSTLLPSNFCEIIFYSDDHEIEQKIEIHKKEFLFIREIAYLESEQEHRPFSEIVWNGLVDIWNNKFQINKQDLNNAFDILLKSS